jgi:hypothetical protein
MWLLTARSSERILGGFAQSALVAGLGWECTQREDSLAQAQYFFQLPGSAAPRLFPKIVSKNPLLFLLETMSGSAPTWQ